MTIIKLTKDNIDTIIDKNQMVVADFWAEWCGPCRVFGDIFEEVAKKYPNIIFGKINIEEEPDLSKDFEIRSIPTLMVFRGNVAVYRESGMLSATAFEKLINDAIALDVSKFA